MKKLNTNSNSIHLGCEYMYIMNVKGIYKCMIPTFIRNIKTTKYQIIHILFQSDFKYISIPQKCIKTEIEQIKTEMIFLNNDLPL